MQVCWNVSASTDGSRLLSRGNPDPKEPAGVLSWGHLSSILPTRLYHLRRSQFLSSYLAESKIELYFLRIGSVSQLPASFEKFLIFSLIFSWNREKLNWTVTQLNCNRKAIILFSKSESAKSRLCFYLPVSALRHPSRDIPRRSSFDLRCSPSPRYT